MCRGSFLTGTEATLAGPAAQDMPATEFKFAEVPALGGGSRRFQVVGVSTTCACLLTPCLWEEPTIICILVSLKASFSKHVDFSSPAFSAKPLKDPDDGVHLVGIICSLKA